LAGLALSIARIKEKPPGVLTIVTTIERKVALVDN